MNTPNPSRIPWRDEISSISCSDRSRMRTPSHAHWAASTVAAAAARISSDDQRERPDAVIRGLAGARSRAGRAPCRGARGAASTSSVSRSSWRSAASGTTAAAIRSAITPGACPSASAVSSRSGGRSSACSRRRHASRMRASAADTSAVGATSSSCCARDDPVERVARPLAFDPDAPLTLDENVVAAGREPLPAHDLAGAGHGMHGGLAGVGGLEAGHELDDREPPVTRQHVA